MSTSGGIRLDNLNEVWQQIASIIGMDNVKKLMDGYGGAYLYIPKSDKLDRAERNEQIRADFNGYNFRELAKKYHLTEVSIRSIVADEVKKIRSKPLDGQTTFFLK